MGTGLLAGYAGRILRIDLTKGKVVEEPLDQGLARMYVGGYGTAGRILYDEVPPWVGALDPENRLIFSTGPITGTMIPTAGRHTVVTKSPLTGYFGDASAGGFWGAELKFSGFDMIVFTGRAARPVCLSVRDGRGELKDASPYWGMDCRAVERALRKDLGDDSARVACIGPAGENLVRIAAIMNDDAGRAAARCGVGAVMGFMKLKAVAVRGHLKVPVADEEKVRGLSKKLMLFQRQDGGVKEFRRSGTPGFFGLGWELGDTPAYNWADGEFDAEKLTMPGPYETILESNRSCYVCPVGCRRVAPAISEAPYQIEAGVEGVEYETLAALGSNCGVDDLRAIAQANDLCNLYGIDTISAGCTAAFAMECFERGLLTREVTGGLELRFGNGKALVELVELMAYRKGIGGLLAEGTRRASRAIPGSEGYAIHVKGLEIAMHDPRSFQGGGVHYATTPTGGRHMEGYTVPLEIVGLSRPELGYPERLDRFLVEGKAKAAKTMQDFWAVINAMGWCIFTEDSGAYPNGSVYPEVYSAVTGVPLTLQEALIIGERIFTLKKAFNSRHGCGPEEDTLPERLLKEPNRRSQGAVVRLNEMLPEYYALRSWDPATSRPLPEKLWELGLQDISEDIWGPSA